MKEKIKELNWYNLPNRLKEILPETSNEVGNGTVTITQGGSVKGSFTTNQSEDTTIDLSGGDLTFGNGLRLEDGVVKWGSPSHDSTEGLLEGETYVTYKNGIYYSQLQFLEDIVRLYCGDETNNSEVSVSSNNFEFFAYNSGYSSTFSFTTTYGFEINDNIHSKGLKYGNDYSANGKLDDRWIPDWGAVKSHVTWGNLANKPTTFAPIIGTTSTTAKAGNYTPSATEIVTAIEAMTPEQVSAIQTKLGITPAVE